VTLGLKKARGTIAAAGIALMAFTGASRAHAENISRPMQILPADVPMPPVRPAPPKPSLNLQLYDNLLSYVADAHYAHDRYGKSMRTILNLRRAVDLGKKDPLEAVNEVLELLDPYSTVLRVTSQNAHHEQSGWNGLGLDLSIVDSQVRVRGVFYRGNAQGAGIRDGDIITHINDEAIAGKTLKEIKQSLCTMEQPGVMLSVKRDGQADPETMTVHCDFHRAYAVHAKMLPGNIGYLRVDRFTSRVAEDVMAVFSEMKTVNPQGYILDLRDNRGGFLHEAHQMIDAMLDSTEVMTKTMTRKASVAVTAKPGDITLGKDIIVLINGGSCSASEVVAGVLQKHRRVKVLGLQSCGKGSIQNVYRLNARGVDPEKHEGKAIELRITIGFYLLPDGSSAQLSGIIPDVLVPGTYTSHTQTDKYANQLENPVASKISAGHDNSCQPPVSWISGNRHIKAPDGKPDLAVLCAMLWLIPEVPSHVPVKAEAVPPQTLTGLRASAAVPH